MNCLYKCSTVLDLNEVFMMSQRINANLNILNNSFEADQCDSLFKEIEKKWNLIYNTIRKSSINVRIDCVPSLLGVIEFFSVGGGKE